MDGKKTSTHALRNCSAGGNAGKSKSPDDKVDEIGSYKGNRREYSKHPNGNVVTAIKTKLSAHNVSYVS